MQGTLKKFHRLAERKTKASESSMSMKLERHQWLCFVHALMTIKPNQGNKFIKSTTIFFACFFLIQRDNNDFKAKQ